MAVINNATPATTTDSSNGLGFLLGVILLIVFILGLFYYVLPGMQRSFTAPSVQVPGKVDVNVNSGQGK